MTPELLLRWVVFVIGWLLYRCAPRRRHIALANLYHAYPERTEAWRRQTLKESCRQLIEMGLFVLASPYMSERRLRRSFQLGEDVKKHWEEEARRRDGKPGAVVALVPHTSLFEVLTLLPMLSETPMTVATVYRPFDSPMIEKWVLKTRQRFGMRMISRKQGLGAASHFLAEGGVVALLFDQNAGEAGLLTTFYNRVCSTSELPGILASRQKAMVYAVWAQRTGFWRATIRCDFVTNTPETPAELCFLSNRWLEDRLRSDDNMCAQWLWLHNRWRTQDNASRRFNLRHRRNGLAEECAWRGLDAMPRGTHFWVRLPNWLGDVMMALPLLRAMRRSRPDGFFTVLAAPHFIPLLEALGVADRCLPLPPKGKRGYWRKIRAMRTLYPHVQVLFTNSMRGDLEARLIGAPQTFGIARKGRGRPLLRYRWPLPDGLDEAAVHQTELWRRFLEAYGLEGEPDTSLLSLAPLPLAQGDAGSTVKAPPAPEIFVTPEGSRPATHTEDAVLSAAATVGLVCGTENSPEKRWPVERWRELVSVLSAQGMRCVLFGTRNDAAITAQVAAGFSPQAVVDRAGKTDLLRYAHELQHCDLLVTNDTGGMHLANALGVSVVVVFGPTNPVRTGPVFAAPRRCLQPPGCPPQGGAAIEGVTVAMVMDAVQELLPAGS